MSELGFRCGPPVNIGVSGEYNMAFNHVLHWVTYLLGAKKLKAVMLSPPCTTFSIMRRPWLRSAEAPFGFCPHEEKTFMGNLLGQHGSQVMKVAAVNGAAGILDTTYSSYLKHLPGWKAIRKLPCAEEVRCDSCAFGSCHLKPFRFLGVNAALKKLARRCSCTCPHVRVQGQFAKASATYVPGLVDALVSCFSEAIVKVSRIREEQLEVEVSGLENQLVNEVALTAPWKVH